MGRGNDSKTVGFAETFEYMFFQQSGPQTASRIVYSNITDCESF